SGACPITNSAARASRSSFRAEGHVAEVWFCVLVFHEASLRRILRSYFDYYHRSRTHLSLGKDSPEPRGIQPPEMGSVVALPQVGGLHYRYERRAAGDPAILNVGVDGSHARRDPATPKS